MNTFVANPSNFGPLHRGQGFAVEFQKCYAALIPALLRWSRPSAILFGVVAVIVDSVNGMFWRWRIAHICQKVFKIFPSVTNANAAKEIIFSVRAYRFIAATSGHKKPSVVFFGCFPAIGVGTVSVFFVRLACALLLKTPARFCVAVLQLICRNCCAVTAFTKAIPCHAGAGVWSSTNYCQSAKFHTRKVFK